ncbi:50S ribosomal protein L11 methyltransferase [Pseudidiomarina insulisalsae]|nr:50S ribosomal protein L11 methyltransferase [Pseudidiomarina insulisalsae]
MNEVKHYKINEHTIALEQRAGVFAPSAHGLYFAENVSFAAGESVIDVGCGSGVLAILAALQGAHVTATDIAANATALTQANAQRNGVNVETFTGGFFAGQQRSYDVIVANLPQEIVAPTAMLEAHTQRSEIDGGLRGNDLVVEMLQQAPAYMHASSRLYLPLHTLSDYQHTLAEAFERYQVRWVSCGELAAKPFVTDHLPQYLELLQQGIIRLYQRNEKWWTNVYVIELTLK